MVTYDTDIIKLYTRVYTSALDVFPCLGLGGGHAATRASAPERRSAAGTAAGGGEGEGGRGGDAAGAASCAIAACAARTPAST